MRLGGDEEASEFTNLLVVKDATGDDDDDGDVYGVECEGDSRLGQELFLGEGAHEVGGVVATLGDAQREDDHDARVDDWRQK